MKVLFAFFLMFGVVNAGYIDFSGDGGTANFDGTTLSGSANISALGSFPVQAELTFDNTNFSLIGSVSGVTSTETLYSGTFSNFEVSHIGGNFSFILEVGSGTLAPDLSSYLNITPLQDNGLSITVSNVNSATFTNATISSTDFSLVPAVPEPSSFVLVSLGLLSFGIYLRR